TTRTSPTSVPGSGRATPCIPGGTRRSSPTSTPTSPSARTSEEAAMTQTIKNLTLKIWRQNGPSDAGHFETHHIAEISDEASFLELLDILNERLIDEGKEAI